jgi:hypothetical protein
MRLSRPGRTTRRRCPRGSAIGCCRQRCRAAGRSSRWSRLVRIPVAVLRRLTSPATRPVGLARRDGALPISAGRSADLVVGGLSQLAAACLGATVGMFCSRRVIPLPG